MWLFSKRHSFEVRMRAFGIWQHLGFNPWEKPRENRPAKREKGSGDFYKGAFDSIPFLNEDAKRTFVHLLLRPGYMIRDYIHGQHERYLAPLTSLIIFYAFFALVSAILQPVQHKSELPVEISYDDAGSTAGQSQDTMLNRRAAVNVAQIVQQGYLYLNLDQHPEAVDTQQKAAIAALESTLRSQGIPLFLSEFLLLWLAMAISLRRYRPGWSACAAASAYVLCQFSFFMLFAVLLTWGKSTSINVLLMLFLLVVDYHQWLGITWKKSFWQAVRTGVCYGVVYGLVILMISFLVLTIALFSK